MSRFNGDRKVVTLENDTLWKKVGEGVSTAPHGPVIANRVELRACQQARFSACR